MISPTVHDLGPDPNTKYRLNAWSYQQHTITSFQGWQYAAFYRSDQPKPDHVRHVVLSRRCLIDNAWESLELRDYEQTADDGHNTVSIGICRGDGTLHISFDHHCDQLRYRVSAKGLALHPEEFSWSASLFGPVLESLGSNGPTPFPITYPRFVSAGTELLLECRLGK